MKGRRFTLFFAVILILSLVFSACTQAPATTQAPAANPPVETPKEISNPPAKQIELVVWDYYGESTPVKPLIEPFEKANPDIKIKYEAIDWDTMLEKMNVVLTGGTPPDVATVDMTWLPKYASLDAFVNLKEVSGNTVNGTTWDQIYSPGALEAITFKNKIVAALYDFDVYALFYRSDIFEQKGLQPPKTWDELVSVAQKLVEGDKYRYEFDADEPGETCIY